MGMALFGGSESWSNIQCDRKWEEKKPGKMMAEADLILWWMMHASKRDENDIIWETESALLPQNQINPKNNYFPLYEC